MATKSKTPRANWTKQQRAGAIGGTRRKERTTQAQRSAWSRKASVIRWERERLGKS